MKMCLSFIHEKISFVCIQMKANFHDKNCAPSLAVIMAFKATQKWPIIFHFKDFYASGMQNAKVTK